MIWAAIWIGIVVFTFQEFFIGFMAPESGGGYFFTAIFYSFICAFSGGLLFGAAYGIGEAFPTHAVEGTHHSLMTIRDKDGVQGQFFLGSGFIESQPYYFYYEKIDGGGLRPGKLSADSSVIVYEEDRKDAELVVFDWIGHAPWWAVIVCFPHELYSGHSYDFHVPRGTVRAGYSM